MDRLRHASYISNTGGTATVDSSYGLPRARSSAASAVSTAKRGTSDITQGRLSLAAIEVIIFGMVAFYWWTHSVQGGG